MGGGGFIGSGWLYFFGNDVYIFRRGPRCKCLGKMGTGFRKRFFPLPPPAPKKEEKSVLPVWRGRATPATRSLLIWQCKFLPSSSHMHLSCRKSMLLRLAISCLSARWRSLWPSNSTATGGGLLPRAARRSKYGDLRTLCA